NKAADIRVLAQKAPLVESQPVRRLILVDDDNYRCGTGPVADCSHPLVNQIVVVGGVLPPGFKDEQVEAPFGQEESVRLVHHLLAAEVPHVQSEWSVIRYVLLEVPLFDVDSFQDVDARCLSLPRPARLILDQEVDE